jgi:hypothetical protein
MDAHRFPIISAILRNASIGFIAALMLLGASVARADFHTVNSTDDPGVGDCASTCTLRDAVASAADGDVVNFDLALFGTPQTITLTAGEILIDHPDASLTIVAPGADLLTISGNHASRVFRVTAGTHLYLQGATISDGAAADVGGGIASDGSLDLKWCVVTNNSAAPGSGGGGIYAGGGGGAFSDCTFSNNSAETGGGVQIVNGSATFTNCTISGNAAADTGGGIDFTADAGQSILQNLHLVATTIAFNSASSTGGLAVNANGDVLTIASLRNTIIAANDGGDLGKTGDPGAVLTSDGFNLIGDGASDLSISATDLIDTDPKLAPLKLYGGTTPTHALLIGSPALDRGDSGGIVEDQRAAPRPVNLGVVDAPPGDSADIGAFEAQSNDLLFINGFEKN